MALDVHFRIFEGDVLCCTVN